MENLKILYDNLKGAYDGGQSPIAEIIKIGTYCINKLHRESNIKRQGNVVSKIYNVFERKNEYSRPYLSDLYISNTSTFIDYWQEIISNIDTTSKRINLEPSVVDKSLYTTVISFACCYDLWKRSSRKTPGTFFEVVLGSLIQNILPNFNRTKHIHIPRFGESVSTDIVFSRPDGKINIVIPAKITTRERIVQPFAHQRILESVFGKGHYNSVLMCVSEIQRDKNENVKEICVPGTIKLFQKHLATLKGIYYLDAPIRYCQQDLKSIIEISSVGQFLTKTLPDLT